MSKTTPSPTLESAIIKATLAATTDASPVSEASSYPLYQPYISRSTWTFTQGFLLGQVVFVIICGVFIKYVVFDEGDKNKDKQTGKGRQEVRKVSLLASCELTYRSCQQKVHLSTHPVPPPSTANLLDKVGYDMSTHPAESADWLNVLFSQVGTAILCTLGPSRSSNTRIYLSVKVLQGYRNDLLGTAGEEGARSQVERWLNPGAEKARSWLVSAITV